MVLSTPQKQFSLTFSSSVWQVRPDFEEELLAIELRDGDRLQTEFVVIDCKTGQSGTPYRASENWWVGLEETRWRLLFLHGFADQKVGAHAGITIISVDGQQLLWRNEQAVFYGLAANSKVLAQPNSKEKEIFFSLDAHTGAILENTIRREQAYAAVTEFSQAQNKPGRYPVHHPAGSAYFVLLSQFIFSHAGRQVEGAIEYLEVESLLIMSYYEAIPAGKWKNILGVFSADNGQLLMEEVLHANVAGLGLNAYFVMNNNLLFIQEKNTLVSYKF